MATLLATNADRLNVYVMDSRDNMGRLAAQKTAECIRTLLSQKESIRMIFAAAPSQNETLFYLSHEPNIDWSRVHAFHMDEYIGLPSDAPQAFGNYLREHIFGRLPFGSVTYINGQNPDPEAECVRYTALLNEAPVDIVCLGIGENGHIAFNDPWVADFDDPKAVKQVPLDPVCRQQQVNDGCFASLEEVPTHAITLTIPTLAKAAHLFCTVPASTKRNAVRLTVTGPVSKDVPATVMRTHPDAALFCDPDSGADLLA